MRVFLHVRVHACMCVSIHVHARVCVYMRIFLSCVSHLLCDLMIEMLHVCIIPLLQMCIFLHLCCIRAACLRAYDTVPEGCHVVCVCVDVRVVVCVDVVRPCGAPDLVRGVWYVVRAQSCCMMLVSLSV